MEPWGEDRADLRSGIVASTIANVNRGKGQRALKPEDFMPYLQKERKESGQRPKPLNVMRAWFGDRVKRSPASGSDQ